MDSLMSAEALTKEQLLSELNMSRKRVTQLELAYSAQQSEMKKGRLWLENSPICTKILDLDFNLQYMSSSGVKELQIDDINKHYGHPYPFHFYPDSFKVPMRNNLKVAKNSGKTITQVASVVDIEGNELWYHSTIVPVKDSAGNPDYIMVVSLDITAQKQAEEELSQVYNILQETEKISKLGGWELITDPQSVVWSDQVYRIHEVPIGAEYSLDDALDFYVPEDRKRLKEALDLAVSKGIPFDLELKFITAKGKKRFTRAISTPVMKDGKVERLRGTFRDITDHKQSEAERVSLESQLNQSHKLKAVGTMAGGIAHELNNVLQSMFLYGGIVEAGLPPDKELKENFQQLLDHGARAKIIVQQMLTFSRNTSIEMKPQSLHEIVLEALSLERLSLSSNIEIRQNIDMHVSKVLCDRAQVHQIIMNLCNNASQAMEVKGGIIRVDLHQIKTTLSGGDAEVDVIELQISDTGYGMDEVSLERIFDPSYTSKEVGKGSGLGLSVVRGIVEMMQGQISVSSIPGQGTTFTIIFPVNTEIEAIKADRSSKMLSYDVSSILIVDDEESIRLVAEMILKQRGFIVDSASTGKQAFTLFKNDPDKYDLIISDLSMPEMSGDELCQAIRKTGSDIPIILSTGHLGVEELKEFKSYGITAMIKKPWTTLELIDAIRNINL